MGLSACAAAWLTGTIKARAQESRQQRRLRRSYLSRERNIELCIGLYKLQLIAVFWGCQFSFFAQGGCFGSGHERALAKSQRSPFARRKPAGIANLVRIKRGEIMLWW